MNTLLILLGVAVIVVLALALAGCNSPSVDYTTAVPFHSLPGASEFNRDEALAMVEFCVDLDSQDDRNSPNARNIYKVRTDRISQWDLKIDSRALVSDAKGLTGRDRLDPTKNGFDPFDTAWTLWKGRKASPEGRDVYMLTIRGTVFEASPSAVEDALVTTLPGIGGIEIPPGKFLPINFAYLPRAEVHEGFAYGAFGLLFDNRFGILPRLMDDKVIPPGSTLILTGHSQGAALATLVHAFLYYADHDKLLGISDKRLHLRSYVLAQPKPGNLQFGMDFAGITGVGATSFVFNNTLDPVPMVPTTHSFTVGAFQDTPTGGTQMANHGLELLRGINSAINQVNRFFARQVENKTANRVRKIQNKNREVFWRYADLEKLSSGKSAGGYSQNFTSAGAVVPLQGLYAARDYYGNDADSTDEFIQHHATTYRRLLEILYGLPPTTEASRELGPAPGAAP